MVDNWLDTTCPCVFEAQWQHKENMRNRAVIIKNSFDCVRIDATDHAYESVYFYNKGEYLRLTRSSFLRNDFRMIDVHCRFCGGIVFTKNQMKVLQNYVRYSSTMLEDVFIYFQQLMQERGSNV